MGNTTHQKYLCHYGVLGMKWGVRRSPEQLDHRRRKSLDKPGDKKHTKSGRSGLTDKQKKVIKVGAAVAVTALDVWGTYQLGKSGKLDPIINKGRMTTEKMLRKKAGSAGDFEKQKFDDKTVKIGKDAIDSLLNQNEKSGQTVGGLKKLSRPETLEETLRNVNPHRGDPDFANNCSACGVASFLRTIGFDVVAKRTGGKQQLLGGVVEECFKGAKVIDGSAVKFGRSREDAAEMLVKRFGDNTSGVVSVQWKKSIRNGGHVFNWQTKDGVVAFFDGQANRDNSVVSRLYWNWINSNDSLTIARLDNAEINFEAIQKYVENR